MTPNAQPRPPSRVTVRRLLRLAQPEWKTILLATFFLFLGSGATLAFPQAIRSLIDGALQQGLASELNAVALQMFVVFAVMGVAVSMRYALFTSVGERIVSRLREDLFRTLLKQEVAFFDERRTGELTNRLASDTTVLQNTVSANISMVLRNGAQALGALALLVWTSPKLTLVMLAVVPAVAIGAVAYGRRVRGLSKQVQDSLAQASEVAEESLSGIRTVRSFTAEEAEGHRYAGAVQRSFRLARNRAIQAATFMGVASFCGFGAGAAVLWYGGRLVLAGELTVGALTSFLVYTMLVAGALGALSELWADFMKASGAAERIFELLDREPSMPVKGGLTLPKVQGRVELREVGFAYPSRRDVQVLRGLSLTLEAGEVVALVGPSGAGKSTIAGLLARLYDPDSGGILLDGHPLTALDPQWLRRQVGTVAQEPLLFSDSIAENIRYGRPDATDAEVEAAARVANAHEFISRFPEGYATKVGERGVQLSGGQRQRVAIARAVLKDPRILVLDEATSALDAESEHLVQEALERLMQGRTTLIIAHRLSTVRNADRVLVLDGGRVVQSGEHSELMSEQGLYRRLVERQFVVA
ncbi:MAG: ATP-binding cassette domain-containing protein [Myxococcaceae bacterium]|nr:ATP-binding cassette domain-containing protein [Myxococcaceae bacterium]MCI0673033.1 ATP-binding cassette domain-containing protein [Myxococcaceae bacterium]